MSMSMSMRDCSITSDISIERPPRIIAGTV